MSRLKAINTLNEFTVEYSGRGSKVIDMSPKGGSRVKEGATVKLLLNDE